MTRWVGPHGVEFTRGSRGRRRPNSRESHQHEHARQRNPQPPTRPDPRTGSSASTHRPHQFVEGSVPSYQMLERLYPHGQG
jgi:hypothetical protein